jgi:hypothetical protein
LSSFRMKQLTKIEADLTKAELVGFGGVHA